MRILTDEQGARMEHSLDMMTAPIRYCSATKGDSDYKYVGECWVHRKVLQNIPYRECDNHFEVFYLDKWRSAFKKDFIIDNQ